MADKLFAPCWAAAAGAEDRTQPDAGEPSQTAGASIEERGRLDMAQRTLQVCGRILRNVVATGRDERDVSWDLRGAFPPVRRHTKRWGAHGIGDSVHMPPMSGVHARIGINPP